MTLLFTQKYVGDMCEAIDSMKITAKQKEFARAVMRAAIDFANAKNHMHASPGAKAAAIPSAQQLTAAPIDPTTPRCSICGADVFDPCLTLEQAHKCELPPGMKKTEAR